MDSQQCQRLLCGYKGPGDYCPLLDGDDDDDNNDNYYGDANDVDDDNDNNFSGYYAAIKAPGITHHHYLSYTGWW